MNKLSFYVAKIVAALAISSTAYADVIPNSVPEFYGDSNVLRIPLLESHKSGVGTTLYSTDLQLNGDGTWQVKRIDKFGRDTEITQDEGFDPMLAGQLKSFFDYQLEVNKQPSLALLVEVDGKSWRGVHGKQSNSIGNNTKRAFSDRFRVGSITKLFTANLIMQLIDQGKVSLDDTLDKWFADAVWFASLPNKDKITVRDLLSHRSGLFNYAGSPAFAKAVLNPLERTFAPQTWINIASGYPTTSEPGGEFHYTNTGFIILGLIAQREFKMPYEAAVSQYILEPLRMTNSLVPKDTGIAYPYVHGHNHTTGKVMTYLDPSIAWAAGSVVSDPEDLNRFIKAQVDGALWSPETSAKHLATIESGALPLSETSTYFRGMGITQFKIGDSKFWGHFGQIPGYDSGVFYDPDRKISFVINAGSFSSDGDFTAWINYNSVGLLDILAAYNPDAAAGSARSARSSGLQWSVPPGKTFADIMESGL